MKTFLIYFPFLAWALTLVTFVRPLSASRLVRRCWGGFLLLCAAKFVLYERLGGNAFNPEIPEVQIWIANFLYSGMMLLAAFSFVAWCCRVKGRLLWILPFLAWGLSLRGVYNGLRFPDVREIELAYENLPVELDGYRIVHLTDLHVSAAARRWRTEEIVRRANGLNPNLIVCTGDIVDGTVACESGDVAPLRGLSAPDGVYYCMGNHEYYRDAENWLRQYRDWNFRILQNECVFPHDKLALGGLPDRAGLKNDLSPEPDLAETFAAATNGEFRVLLAHRPCDSQGEFPKTSYDLQLSGHTHGGIMPVLSQIVKVYNRGYVRGLYMLGERTRIYVSAGAGQWAGFPLRFCNDAEITRITLKAR